jgi:putative ABC transport system permease protein
MRWLRRLTGWLRARRNAAALEEELETHRAHAQDELERTGVSRDEAARSSHRRMGNTLLAREDARDVWIVRGIDRLRQHLKFGGRGLRREPAFALTAILTLALGTAAMTTVFSVADGELWRPLPYPEPHRLMAIHSSGPRDFDGIGVDELLEWRAAMPAFSALAAKSGESRSVVRLDITQSIDTSRVTANFFSTLGRPAIAGRVFTSEDAHGAKVAILGSRGWQKYFDARPDLIGRTLFVNNEPRTLVGIVETDDTRGVEDEFFLPIDERATSGPHTDAPTFVTVIGRLAPGATREVALAQAQAVIGRRGEIDPARAGHVALVQDISETYRTRDGRLLYLFLAASVLVLVLTIVNIAGLVLSRGLRRTPEFALRGALGGGMRAIAGQLTVEAALVAVPGCALGWWLAAQAVGLVGQAIPSQVLARGRHIVVDDRALAVCVAVIVITMVGLALAPLGVARRSNPAAVNAGGSRSSGLPTAGRTRDRLLIAQLALTVVLLVAGALFMKSFTAEARIPLGFDPSDGWTMDVALDDAKFKDPALSTQYASALVERARAIPGVRDVAVATSSPLRGGFGAALIRPDVPSPAGDGGARAVHRAVSPRYFRAVGTPIVRGREFLETDVAGAPRVAVVNEEFVRQAFGAENPIGREVEITGARTRLVPSGIVTIVGVAANIKELRPNELPVADVYVPFAQAPVPGLELIVRGNGSSASMAAQLRAVASETDPVASVSTVASLDRRVTVAFQRDRFNLWLAAGFSLVALLIAAIGIYGAMAYAATARAREVGVRLALGASPRRLLQRALWQAARFGVIGAALGLIAAAGVARWIGDTLYTVPGAHNGLLYGVTTTDPMALGAAAAGVIAIALLSGAIPARRLARVDPVTTLRAE